MTNKQMAVKFAAMPGLQSRCGLVNYMQSSGDKAGVAERLIKQQSFREAAKKAFQQADQSKSSDLLQRCRALNACIRQVCGH